MVKDTDDLFTYSGPHAVQDEPKHRAEPNGKKATPGYEPKH